MTRPLLLASLCALFATALPARAEPPIPAMMFTAIETRDIARAEAFYTTALGMKRIVRLSRPSDPFVKDAYNFSGDPMAQEPLLILMHHDGQDARPTDTVLLGMRVADTHKAAAQVRAAGYPVLHEPAAGETGYKLTTLVADPDGNHIELVQLDLKRMP